MKNPTHAELLRQLHELHEVKNADYAHSGNPYSNFEYAAQVAAPFRGVDAVFATMLGIKLARLGELTEPGRTPKNEALDDTFVDLTNYAAIWTSWRRDQRRLGTPAVGGTPTGSADPRPSN